MRKSLKVMLAFMLCAGVMTMGMRNVQGGVYQHALFIGNVFQ